MSVVFKNIRKPPAEIVLYGGNGSDIPNILPGIAADLDLYALSPEDRIPLRIREMIGRMLSDVSSVDESLRIGTFNTQFLPSSVMNTDKYGYEQDDIERSADIAERIIASGYDVIILNEVFDDDAREVFVRHLNSTYPYYVKKSGDLDDVTEILNIDSGLMLFSKFPFAELPNGDPYCRGDNDDVIAPRHDRIDYRERVAYVEYDRGIGFDAYADKGVGFVRIQHPSGRIFNVAFTHMQAGKDTLAEMTHYLLMGGWATSLIESITGDIGAPNIDQRINNIQTSQLQQIQNLIECQLGSADNPDSMFNQQDVLLLGDLNIVRNSEAWRNHFNTTGSFFTDHLHDTWAYETSPEDPGFTSSTPNPRVTFDYIFRNWPAQERQLGINHLTLGYNLRDREPFKERGMGMAGSFDLSDHMGVNAEFNLKAPHCCAENAREPMYGPYMINHTGVFNGSISSPSGMQWVKLTEQGTYSLALVSDDGRLKLRAYDPSDLSTPLESFSRMREIEIAIPTGVSGSGRDDVSMGSSSPESGPPVRWKQFIGSRNGTYVRIFHTDRNWTGSYQLLVHRNECESLEDACVLAPAVPETKNGYYTSGGRFFEINVETGPETGRNQHLRFIVDNYSIEDGLNIQLLDDSENPIVPEMQIQRPDPMNPGKFLTELELQNRGPAIFYLLVIKNDARIESYSIRWHTDLSIFHGQGYGIPGTVLTLYANCDTADPCGFPWTDIEDDYIYMSVEADGREVIPERWVSEFDTEHSEPIERIIEQPIRFFDRIIIHLRDNDRTDNDDLINITIWPLDEDSIGKNNLGSTGEGDGGTYTIYYNLNHWLPGERSEV